MFHLLIVCCFVSVCFGQWFKERPRPTRIFFVEAISNHPIRDGKMDSPFLVSDIETLPPEPGDLFVLGSGVYQTKLDFKHSGNETHPIVITGAPDARATIVGKIDIEADHLWLMNVEVTDPQNKYKVSSAIDMRGNHIRVINCIVHDTFQGHGINSFYGYKGNVIYGNIIYGTGKSSGARPDEELPADAIRATNHFEVDGTKYIIGNLIVGIDNVCEKCRGFSGHSDPDDDEFDKHRASGFHLEDNIFDQSWVVLGGYGPPSDNNIVKNNYFGESELQLGFASPTQAEVTGNLIAWSYLDARYMWGSGDKAYGAPTKGTVIRNNRVFHPPVDNDLTREDDLPLIDLGTAIYTDAEDKNMRGARPALGSAPFSGLDQLDDNVYGSPAPFFRLNAAGVKTNRIETMEAWRSATQAAGGNFEASSRISTYANMSTVVNLVDNLYDKHRAYYAVFNFARDEEVELDLKTPFTGIEGSFEVFLATERWNDKPVATGGLPSVKVTVPVNGKRFVSFVVIANKGADPKFLPTERDAFDGCPRFTEGCESGPCREGPAPCKLSTLECTENGKCNIKASASSLHLTFSALIVALSVLLF